MFKEINKMGTSLDEPGGCDPTNCSGNNKRSFWTNTSVFNCSSRFIGCLPAIKKKFRKIWLSVEFFKFALMGDFRISLSRMVLLCSQPHLFLRLGCWFEESLENR